MEQHKRLPDSELEVMLLIWHSDAPIHTGELLQQLSLQKTTNLQTVQSALGRLMGKGFIHCEKLGRLNFYTPLVEEESYRQQETETFLERMYHNSPARLVAALLSNPTLTEEELASIRRMVERGQP